VELVGVPVVLGLLAGILQGHVAKGGFITTGEVGVLFLGGAAVVAVVFVKAYWRVFARIRSAVRLRTDAEDGDTVAVTGEVLADGTIRSPVEQTPVALSAWRSSVQHDNADSDSDVDRDGADTGGGPYGEGHGVHSTIHGLRIQGSSLEVDLPSVITEADTETGVGGGGFRLLEYVAHQTRRTPGLLVEGLLVALPGVTGDATHNGTDQGDDSTTFEQCQYPAGQPPREIRAFVGEHRDRSQSPSLARLFGLTPRQRSADGGPDRTAPTGTDTSTGTATSTGSRGSGHQHQGRSTSPRSDSGTSGESRPATGGASDGGTHDTDSDGPMYSVEAWNISKRETVTILGTYRTGGYVDERITLSDDRVDIFALGGYDRLYRWARSGLFHASYLTGWLALFGVTFLVY